MRQEQYPNSSKFNVDVQCTYNPRPSTWSELRISSAFPHSAPLLLTTTTPSQADMGTQATIGIPYRQFSILNRWMADIGRAQLARFAALPDAERNKFHDLSPLELHQKGAGLCQWILIRHPAVGDDMDDGEEGA